ncbi:MAG: hypothetical protein IPM95_01090 [Sphingobacteriales bacterium]|nr:hypothetical protein [Sphingobacteriales bacterium]
MKKVRIGKKVLFIVSMAILVAAACKKEKSDPNIIYRLYNLALTDTTSLTAPELQLNVDIDGDSVMDYALKAAFDTIEPDTIIRRIILQHGDTNNNKVLATSTFLPNGIYTSVLKQLYADDAIDSNSVGFNNTGDVLLRAFKGTELFGYFGFYDDTEKLIGLKFKIGSETHYGWLRVQLSFDKKTCTIKDGAYQNLADKEIAAGDL